MAAIYYKQASSRDQAHQISGDDQFIVHNLEEYRAYRDIVFWWKCFHAASHPSSSASSTDSTGPLHWQTQVLPVLRRDHLPRLATLPARRRALVPVPRRAALVAAQVRG